jgi:hypothetical protein
LNALKYDDASWHYGGDFPDDLPVEAGATHIGMFVAWAVLNGLSGPIHTEEFPEAVAKLQKRELTPGAWFIEACDEKFTDEDLNDEGNAFAQAYYANDAGLRSGTPNYLSDYETTFANLDSLYHVPDTWSSFETLAPTISRRFLKWRNSQTGWRRFMPTVG